MAAKPFEPVGDVARWVPVYEKFRDLGPEVIVTYAELSEWAGVDVTYDRSPVTRAGKEMLEKDQRGLINVNGVGYRVMHPSEHSEKARQHTKGADRQLQRAIGVLIGTDLNGLTPQERAFTGAMLSAVQAQRDMTRRLSRRTDRLEVRLEDTRQETKAVRRESKEATAELAETVAKQGAALERLQAMLLERSGINES